MALMGQLMGLSVFIVIEKPSELELILEEASKLQVKPLIGLRVRLSTISAANAEQRRRKIKLDCMPAKCCS